MGRKNKYLKDFVFDDCTSIEEFDNYTRYAAYNVINIGTFMKYCEDNEDVYDVILSSDQQNFLKTVKPPLILFGCAGSGKTLLGVHFLFSATRTYCINKPVAYIATSEKLVIKSERLFGEIESVQSP